MSDNQGRYYFVSDVHLGLADGSAQKRQSDFCDFLDNLPEDTAGLFLLGDIFDFWVEYPGWIEPGYDDVLQRFKALTSRGCAVFFFKGNHDWWTLDYFEKELGMTVVDEPYKVLTLCGERLCIGHGDGLGCRRITDLFIFRAFRNPVLIWCLRRLPRRWILSFGRRWSAKSRKGSKDYVFDIENSDIKRWCENFALRSPDGPPIDRFIFGHYHCPCSTTLRCPNGVGHDVEGATVGHNGHRTSPPTCSGVCTLTILGDWGKGISYLKMPERGRA